MRRVRWFQLLIVGAAIFVIGCNSCGERRFSLFKRLRNHGEPVVEPCDCVSGVPVEGILMEGGPQLVPQGTIPIRTMEPNLLPNPNRVPGTLPPAGVQEIPPAPPKAYDPNGTMMSLPKVSSLSIPSK